MGSTELEIHHGTIASGIMIVKNAATEDRIVEEIEEYASIAFHLGRPRDQRQHRYI